MPQEHERVAKNIAFCSICNVKHYRPVGKSCPAYCVSNSMASPTDYDKQSTTSSSIPCGQTARPEPRVTGEEFEEGQLQSDDPSKYLKSIVQHLETLEREIHEVKQSSKCDRALLLQARDDIQRSTRSVWIRNYSMI